LIKSIKSDPIDLLTLEIFMSQEDAKKILERLKKYTDEITSSKEKALKALIDAGLVTADGQPTDLYKN